MANSFTQLVNWFIPEELHKEAEIRRKARLTISACLILQPFFIITAIKWIKSGHTLLIANIGLTMALIMLSAFLVKWFKSTRIAVEALLIAMFIYFTVYNVLTGGISSSSVYWMFSSPMIAVLLSGPKSAFFWIAAILAEIIGLKYMKLHGMDFDILNYQSVELIAFKTENFVKQILAIAFILYFVEKDRIKARDEQNEAIEAQKKSAEEQLKSQEELARTAIQLKTTFENMLSQAEMLNIESRRLGTSGSNISAGFQEAADQSKLVSCNTSEINANLQDISLSVETAATSLQSVLTRVEDASKVANTAVKETKEAEALISDLSQSSTEIGKVTEMIREISEQTNLLALNATIEAARAGEAGRGFAVVADEIKNLSVKTREATGEIQGRIRINDDTVGKVVSKNNEIEKIIDTISKMQGHIHESLTSQSETIRNIASITADSARKSDHIASGAARLSDSVISVEKEIDEIVSSSSTLSGIAQELQKMTSVVAR